MRALCVLQVSTRLGLFYIWHRLLSGISQLKKKNRETKNQKSEVRGHIGGPCAEEKRKEREPRSVTPRDKLSFISRRRAEKSDSELREGPGNTSKGCQGRPGRLPGDLRVVSPTFRFAEYNSTRLSGGRTLTTVTSLRSMISIKLSKYEYLKYNI